MLLAVPLILWGSGPQVTGTDLTIQLHAPGLMIGPNSAATLPIPTGSINQRKIRLVLTCGATNCPQDMRATAEPDKAPTIPVSVDDGEVEFLLVRNDLGRRTLTIANPSPASVLITSAQIRNYVAFNSGIPGFVALLNPRQAQSYGALGQGILLLVMLLVLAAASRWSLSALHRWFWGWRQWVVLAGPALCLSIWALLRFLGLGLVFSWDAVFLLAGVGWWVQFITRLPGYIRSWVPGTLGSLLLMDWLAFILPGLVMFIYTPFMLFMPQSEEFDNNLFVMVYLLVAFGVWIILSGAVLLLGRGLREKLVKLMFFLGVFVLVRDVVAPVRMGLLNGLDLDKTVAIPWTDILAEVVLLAVIIALFFKCNWRVIRKYAGTFVLLSLIVESTIILSQFDAGLHFSAYGVKPNHANGPPPPTASKGANIYHIILDTFSSHAAESLLNNPVRRHQLGGFIFFPNNRANLLHTSQSVPSFMTGTYPPFAQPKEGFKQWKDRVNHWRGAGKVNGLLAEAYRRGYTVTQYLPALRWFSHQKASYVYSAMDIRSATISQAFFCDLWLLRISPALLKNVVFKEEHGLFSRLMTPPGALKSVFWSEQQMNRAIMHEKQRPSHGQYVYIHLAVPHNPVILDEQCNYVPGWKREYDDDAYTAQAACALCLTNRFLKQLKKLGRFRESTIIIHADHGLFGSSQVKQYIDRKYLMSDELFKSMHHRERCDIGSLALLLIKPPHRSAEQVLVDSRSVSLIDLPQTIYSLNQWNIRTKVGRFLFKKPLRDDRRIDIFVGLHPIFPKGVRHVILENGGWRINRHYPLPDQSPSH